MMMKRVAIVALVLGCAPQASQAKPNDKPADKPSEKAKALQGDVSLIVTPDPKGHPAFIDAIGTAQHTIRMAMFHLTDTDVVAALVAAHARGVDVRVILDGSGLENKRFAKIAETLRASGATVKASSKGFTITHEKALLIDDATILVTAINLTKTATDTRDFGLVLHDPGVMKEFAAVFEADWANADSGGTTTPAVSDPHLVWSPVNSEERLSRLAGSGKTSVIATVENLGDPKMIEAFGASVRAGATVRVIVPACDKDPHPERNYKYVYELQKAKVDVRVMPAPPSAAQPYMHSKMIVADGAHAYVGSVNFSTNSMTKAREVGLLFDEPAPIQKISAVFEDDWKVAVPPPKDPPTDCPEIKD